MERSIPSTPPGMDGTVALAAFFANAYTAREIRLKSIES